MENSGPLILEISSDEEASFGDTRKGSDYGGVGGVFGDGEDCNWLSKLLDEVGGKFDDDSDDVVLVSEVLPKPSKKSRSESLKPSAIVVDDDDCVILDGDPDKPVVVASSRADDSGDSDDVEIVGEKGEVACRDFPHARHLCAKFPFASSPHEVHCSQCHCYVCDSLAPCSHWGTGVSSIDHCHASDKEQYWKAERKHMKKGDEPVPVTSTTSGTLEEYFPAIQVPALVRPQSNSLPQNRGFNPVTIPPCSMSSNVSLPNAINHRSGYAVPEYRPQSLLSSLQSHSTSNNNVASRDKSHHVGSRNPQSFPPLTVFKRHGSVGPSPNNRQAYRSPLSRDPSLKRCRSFQTSVVNGRHGSNQQNVGSQTVHSVIPQRKPSSPHSMNGRRANYLPIRIHSRPYSSSLSQDQIQCQSRTPGQPYANGNFPIAAPLQPSVSAQPPIVENIRNMVLPQPQVFQPNNCAPSQAVASYRSDAGNTFGNQLHSGSMNSSHPNAGNNLENQSSQPQAHTNPTSLLNDGENDVQQRNQAQNGIDVSPADYSFFSDSSLNNGNLQINAEESRYQSTAPAETSQVQNVPKSDHQSIATVDNFHRQSAVLADYTSPVNDADCQFPESTGPGPLDFQLDNWMFENQSFLGAVEVSATPNWDVYSPEPAFIGTGTLFDF